MLFSFSSTLLYQYHNNGHSTCLKESTKSYNLPHRCNVDRMKVEAFDSLGLSSGMESSLLCYL